MTNTTYVESLLPANFHVSDLDWGNKESYRTAILVINGVFFSLAMIFLALRLHAKIVIIKNFAIEDGEPLVSGVDVDDWMLIRIIGLALAATATSLAFSILMMYATHWGLGTHVWNIEPDHVIEILMHMLELTTCVVILYSVALTLAKLSIIGTYIRVFPVRWFRITLSFIAFVIIAQGVCTSLVIIFTCRPIKAVWNIAIVDAKCIDTVAYLYVAGVLNITTDFALCLLPLPLVHSLTMLRGKRLTLGMLFSVGFLAFGASVIRITYLNDLAEEDVSFTSVKPALWSVVEVDVVLCCASAPSIKSLLSKLWPDGFKIPNFISSSSRPSRAELGSENSILSTPQLECRQQPHLPAFQPLGVMKDVLKGEVDVIQLASFKYQQEVVPTAVAERASISSSVSVVGQDKRRPTFKTQADLESQDKHRSPDSGV